jgi:hypothetical protein
MIPLALAISGGPAACALDEPDSADSERPVPPPSCSSPGVNCGLTWVKAYHTNATGQDTVTCHDYTSGLTTPTSCNPYIGDTDCNGSRPILCIRQDGSASNGFVGSPLYDAFYNGWAKGNIGITHPILGVSLTSLAVADAACVTEFGVGWRMAEHHDAGGGWQWTAYGNLNDVYTEFNTPSHTLNDRFWVYINAQDPGDPPGGTVNPQVARNSLSTLTGNCW